MSAKRRLAETIEAMPESLTMEEIIERLYYAFKLKQEHDRTQDARSQTILERLAAEGRVALGQPNTATAYPVIPGQVPAGLVERLIDEGRGDR